MYREEQGKVREEQRCSGHLVVLELLKRYDL